MERDGEMVAIDGGGRGGVMLGRLASSLMLL